MSMSKFMYCQKILISLSHVMYHPVTLLDVLVTWFTTCQRIRILGICKNIKTVLIII